MLDAAVLPFLELFQWLGGPSSMEIFNSIGGAHGIDVSDNNSKDKKAAKIIDHITHG